MCCERTQLVRVLHLRDLQGQVLHVRDLQGQMLHLKDLQGPKS